MKNNWHKQRTLISLTYCKYKLHQAGLINTRAGKQKMVKVALFLEWAGLEMME